MVARRVPGVCLAVVANVLGGALFSGNMQGTVASGTTLVERLARRAAADDDFNTRSLSQRAHPRSPSGQPPDERHLEQHTNKNRYKFNGEGHPRKEGLGQLEEHPHHHFGQRPDELEQQKQGRYNGKPSDSMENLEEHSPETRRGDNDQRELLIVSNSFFVDTCFEGQSFTVTSPSYPGLEGCYAVDMVLGQVPPVVGQYVYTSPRPEEVDARGDGREDVAGDGAPRENVVATTVFFDPSFVEDVYWVLMTTDNISARSTEETVYCVSAQRANMFNHPSEVTWACDLTGNMGEVAAPTDSELTVTCGCPGRPRNRFDVEAAEIENNRKRGRKMKFGGGNRGRNSRNGGGGTNSDLGGGSSSSSFGAFHFFVFTCALIAVAVRFRARARPTADTGVGSGSGGGGAIAGAGVVEGAVRRPAATAWERLFPPQCV